MKRYVSEVESALSTFPKRTSAHHPESYIGGGQSSLRYLGIRVPDVRRVLQAGFSFSTKEPDEVAKIWNYVWWNSDCYEVMSLALAWFENPKHRPILKKSWADLKKWSARVDNWAHSDGLSGIYARLHEEHPAEIYETLKKWNVSKNPWFRRLSIVSLFYYSSQRQRYPSFNKVVALLKPQLLFDHYYVQKGVGWTLRETGNVYPDATYKFMESNVHKISAAAFSASVEKMAPPRREYLKRLRKEGRRNSSAT